MSREVGFFIFYVVSNMIYYEITGFLIISGSPTARPSLGATEYLQLANMYS